MNDEMAPMSELKIRLSLCERNFKLSKETKNKIARGEGECFNEFVKKTIEYMIKLEHLRVLILRGMVGGVMPDSLYLSLCARYKMTLYDYLDVEGLNNGEYVKFMEHLKLSKMMIDTYIDLYLAHQSR